MTRAVEFATDEFYHLYNRGTEKRRIFLSRRDSERFLLLLYLCNQIKPLPKIRGSTSDQFLLPRSGPTLVDIGAYCLMPNHFHIIAKEKEGSGISKFMQKLITAYTMYFNKRSDRSGALFQGKFKAVHIDNDRYLNYLISYVHLNPIKLLESKWRETGIENRERAETYLDSYRYSSYADYGGHTRAEAVILARASLPNAFKTPDDFKTHVNTWLSYKP